MICRDAVEENIRGPDLGADDYLVKPFETGELLARMRAVRRRRDGASSPILFNGRILLNPAAHELRSPLTALSFQAERLEAAEMSPPARERLGRLRRGLNRARSLLNQMLTPARVQSPLREEAEDVSLAQAFRQTVGELIP